MLHSLSGCYTSTYLGVRGIVKVAGENRLGMAGCGHITGGPEYQAKRLEHTLNATGSP